MRCWTTVLRVYTAESIIRLVWRSVIRYPARGGMRVLESQYTDGNRGPLERFVAEEMIIDLLGAFDAHRYAAVAAVSPAHLLLLLVLGIV